MGILLSDLQTPMSWGEYVTESIISPFSDKLMLFHTMMLAAASVGNYGLGIAGSPRKGVAATDALEGTYQRETHTSQGTGLLYD